MNETSPLTIERIKTYLGQGKRFDGRKPSDFREIKVETGVSKHAEGSVKVSIGNTEVFVGVKMDVAQPYPDSPDKGNLIVSADLLPLSSPRFEAGPPKFESIEMARIIDRGIRESGYIQFDKLCITPGEKVWTVFLDLYSYNDDGNLLDAFGIGAILALQQAKIPQYDSKQEKVLFGELTDTSLPVDKETLFPITVHKVGETFLIDPTREEEDASETRITIGIQHDRISSMQKGGTATIMPEDMKDVLSLAMAAYKDLRSTLKA